MLFYLTCFIVNRIEIWRKLMKEEMAKEKDS